MEQTPPQAIVKQKAPRPAEASCRATAASRNRARPLELRRRRRRGVRAAAGRLRRRPGPGRCTGCVVWLGFELGIAPVLGLSQAKKLAPGRARRAGGGPPALRARAERGPAPAPGDAPREPRPRAGRGDGPGRGLPALRLPPRRRAGRGGPRAQRLARRRGRGRGAPRETVERFLARLPVEAPPLATVERVMAEPVEELGELGFSIRESPAGGEPRAAVTPDSATCADCLGRAVRPGDRRFRYPFVNCTNCGPRFTIVRDVPYDRPNTTMAGFEMCPACRAEYAIPATAASTPSPTPARSAGRGVRLARGRCAADPRRGRGGAGARSTARSWRSRASAASTWPAAPTTRRRSPRLRARKHREDKPFALMAPDLAAARELVELGPAEERLLARPRGRSCSPARGRARAWPRRSRPARPSSA